MNFLSNIKKNVIGTVISNLILFLSIPVVARIYEISDIGEFAYFYALVTVFSVLTTLRLDLALMNTLGSVARVKLINLIFAVTLLFTILSIIVILILLVCNGVNTNVKLYLIFPFILFSSSLYRIIIMNLLFNARFDVLMWILIINSLVLS